MFKERLDLAFQLAPRSGLGGWVRAFKLNEIFKNMRDGKFVGKKYTEPFRPLTLSFRNCKIYKVTGSGGNEPDNLIQTRIRIRSEKSFFLDKKEQASTVDRFMIQVTDSRWTALG